MKPLRDKSAQFKQFWRDERNCSAAAKIHHTRNVCPGRCELRSNTRHKSLELIEKRGSKRVKQSDVRVQVVSLRRIVRAAKAFSPTLDIQWKRGCQNKGVRHFTWIAWPNRKT